MKSQLYKHVTTHNGKFTWQCSVLGFPCRTSAHFDTAEDAAISVSLLKHYLASEFKLFLAESMCQEQFSCLAFSRRNVVLSNSLNVFSALPPDVKEFIMLHREALYDHRDNSPPESTASKFRRSDMIKLPAVREWVEQLELAEANATAFSAIDSASFFLRLKVVESSLTALLKSLRLAQRMHAGVTNSRLAGRALKLAALIEHLEQDLDYAVDLTENMKAEQHEIEFAVRNLEANRPNLT